MLCIHMQGSKGEQGASGSTGPIVRKRDKEREREFITIVLK